MSGAVETQSVPAEVADYGRLFDGRVRALNPDAARALTVTDAPGYDRAGAMLSGFRDLIDEADRRFEPAVAAAHRAHRALLDLKRDLTAGPSAAVAWIKSQMSAYDREQARLTVERERAERARVEAERVARESAALDRAALLESSGHAEQAKAVVADAVAPGIPVVAPLIAAPAAPPGLSRMARYHAEVVDLMALVRAVAAGTVPLDALAAVPAFLNIKARTVKKDGADIYPGVVARAETEYRRTRGGGGSDGEI